MEEEGCLLPGGLKVEVGYRHHRMKEGPSKSKGEADGDDRKRHFLVIHSESCDILHTSLCKW